MRRCSHDCQCTTTAAYILTLCTVAGNLYPLLRYNNPGKPGTEQPVRTQGNRVLLGENANTGGSTDPTVKGSPATFLFGFTRTPIISGGGDPWFTSFDGVRFPFHGVPGQVFNLVSEECHLINALFVAEANPKHSAMHGVSTGTWMAQVRTTGPHRNGAAKRTCLCPSCAAFAHGPSP